jgi:hypothetical protein
VLSECVSVHLNELEIALAKCPVVLSAQKQLCHFALISHLLRDLTILPPSSTHRLKKNNQQNDERPGGLQSLWGCFSLPSVTLAVSFSMAWLGQAVHFHQERGRSWWGFTGKSWRGWCPVISRLCVHTRPPAARGRGQVSQLSVYLALIYSWDISAVTRWPSSHSFAEVSYLEGGWLCPL